MTTTMSPPSPPPIDPAAAGRRPARWRGRRARSVWMIVGSIATVALLVAGAVQIVARIAHQETTVERTYTAADLAGVRSVFVDNETGSTNIVGTDRDDVAVTARVSRGLLPTREQQRIDGDRLVLTASCPPGLNEFCEVDYQVEVPSEMLVLVRARHGGTAVSDVDGAVEVESRHGGVDLTRLGGDVRVDVRHGGLRTAQLTSPSVDVTTRHGSVVLQFSAPPQRVAVDSRFGSVDVSVPDDGRTYAVSVSTEFGDSSNGLRTDPASGSTIDITSAFGHVVLGYAP